MSRQVTPHTRGAATQKAQSPAIVSQDRRTVKTMLIIDAFENCPQLYSCPLKHNNSETKFNAFWDSLSVKVAQQW